MYYDRCCQKPNIKVVVGTPVDQLLYGSFLSVNSVIWDNGPELQAQKTILAIGAWSSRLVNLDQKTHANAINIAYIKLFSSRIREIPGHRLQNKPYYWCQHLYPSRRLREGPPQNDRSSQHYHAQGPRGLHQDLPGFVLTTLDDPTQRFSADMEQSLREEMREVLPQFANHPFAQQSFAGMFRSWM